MQWSGPAHSPPVSDRERKIKEATPIKKEVLHLTSRIPHNRKIRDHLVFNEDCFGIRRDTGVINLEVSSSQHVLILEPPVTSLIYRCCCQNSG